MAFSRTGRRVRCRSSSISSGRSSGVAEDLSEVGGGRSAARASRSRRAPAQRLQLRRRQPLLATPCTGGAETGSTNSLTEDMLAATSSRRR